ncbi:hypothetical protein ABW20_dc0100116 [Dactylellina cionopaga]|nr:hypothetical protein ABW20_dc0100116 [Dactylellina cionopaga]
MRLHNIIGFIDPSQLETHHFNFLDAWTDENETWQVERGQVPLDEIDTHLRTLRMTGKDGKRCRILCFPARNPRGEFRRKIEIPEDCFREICTHWRLDKRTAETFVDNNGVSLTLNNGDTTSFLFKVCKHRLVGYDTASVTEYKDVDGISNIYVLYHGLNDETGILDMFQSFPRLGVSGFAFIAAVHQSHQRRAEVYRGMVNDRLLSATAKTKYGTPGTLESRDVRFLEFDVVPAEEYDGIVAELSYCQTELAVLGNISRFSLDSGDWLERAMKDSISIEGRMPSLVELDILGDISFAACRAKSQLSQIQHLKERAESQMALNDSRYSASIAEDSKHDSRAMRTIAVLTTLFLPGTFLATYFSMGMFNWNPGDGGRPSISPYIWIYWAVAIPLTAVVMIGWKFWSNREIHWKRKPARGSISAESPTVSEYKSYAFEQKV